MNDSAFHVGRRAIALQGRTRSRQSRTEDGYAHARSGPSDCCIGLVEGTSYISPLAPASTTATASTRPATYVTSAPTKRSG